MHTRYLVFSDAAAINGAATIFSAGVAAGIGLCVMAKAVMDLRGKVEILEGEIDKYREKYGPIGE